jgi:hypothetical protein
VLTLDGVEIAKLLLNAVFGEMAETVVLDPDSRLKNWLNRHRKRGVLEPFLSLAMICAGTLDGISDSSSLYSRFRNLSSSKHDQAQWFEYYRCSWVCLVIACIELFQGVGSDADDHDQPVDDQAQSFTHVKESVFWAKVKEWCGSHPFLVRRLAREIPRFCVELTDRLTALAEIRFNVEPVDDDDAQQVTNSPAMLFLTQVIFPCMLFEGKLPEELLANALVHNDREALEFLLRLDKRLRDYRPVASLIRRRAIRGDTAALDVLNGDRSREKRWDKIDVAVRFAVVVIDLTELYQRFSLQFPIAMKRSPPVLNASEMRRMFVANGFDPCRSPKKRGDQVTSDEAWTARVRRLRKQWQFGDRIARSFVSDGDSG